MRKFILIAAMVLASASAQAGVSRSLTMASNDEPAVAEQPKATETPNPEATNPEATKAEAPKTETPKVETPKAETPAADAPKFVERPAAVDAPANQPKADLSKPVSDKKAEKPRYKHESTEARVIYELHRHGIYW
jgi:hypothetical protein